MLTERLTRRSLLVATSVALIHQATGNKADAMFTRIESSAPALTKAPIALMYHDLNYPHKDKKIEEENWVSPEKFKEQTEDAVRSGRKITTASEALENPTKCVAYTFDDAIHIGYDIIYPYFIPRRMKATFFIPLEFIDKGHGYYMTAQQVKELADNELEIGSHFTRHIPLTGLSDRSLKIGLRDSKNYLEDLIGKEVPLFAYPYGVHSERVATAVCEAGYKAAFLSRKNTRLGLKPPLDRFELPRDWMIQNMTFKDAVQDTNDPQVGS